MERDSTSFNYCSRDDQQDVRSLKGSSVLYRANLYTRFALGRLWHCAAQASLKQLIIAFVSINFVIWSSLVYFSQPKLARAELLTWDGGGTELTCPGNANGWSCPQNWSTDIVPESNDVVNFDNTSSKDSIIDTGFVGHVAGVNIDVSYTGIITAQRSLTTEGDFTIGGGTFNMVSETLNVGMSGVGAGVFTQTGGTFTAPSSNMFIQRGMSRSGGVFDHNNGAVIFVTNTNQSINTGDAVLNIVDFQSTEGEGSVITLENDITTIGNVVISNSDASMITNGSFTIAGLYNINAGGSLIFPPSTGFGQITLDPSVTFNVSGDFTMDVGNDTNVLANIVFVDNSKISTVSGSTIFGGDFCINTPNKEIRFEDGSTQIIMGAFIITGSSGNLIKLTRAGTGSWNIDPQGARDVSYAHISYSNNQNATAITAVNSFDGGFNTNWNILTAPIVPTATTQAPSGITETGATANGTIMDIGSENPTERGFKYGLAQVDTWSVSENGSFNAESYGLTLSGLQAGTTYYVRAYATNSAGTGYGDWQSFTTTLPSVTLSSSAPSFSENGGSVTITATLSNVSSQDVTVNLSFSGVADASEYSRSAWVIVISAGEVNGTVTLTGIDDAIFEPAESITVSIDSVVNATVTPPGLVVVTIDSDDPMPTIQFQQAAASGLESTPDVSVIVSLSGSSSLNITADISVSGTATNGVDYTLSDTALSFAPGETSKSIDIAIINDNSLETDETIILSLTNLFNVASGGVTTYTYTITNDDDTTETQPDTTPDSPSVPATPPSTIWYTVEATTLGHGAITPSGNNVVEAGTSITFAITPDDGYAIDDVVINGVSAGAISSYTFSNVASDQTIRAIFRKPQEPGMASTEKPVPDQSIPTDLANQTEPVQNIEKTDQLSTQISPAALVFENAKQAVGFVSDGIKAAMVALGIEPENVPETTAAAVFVTAAASTVIVPISNLASVVSLPELFRSSWYFFVGWGFTRSRRRKWGKVIELGSRIPIPFAKISLVAIDDNNGEKVINTTYTDRDGNYAFAAQPGRYAVRVTKDGYSIVAVAGSYTPNAVIQVSDYAEGFVIPDITMGIDGVAVNHKSNLIRRFTWAERVFSYLSLIMLVFGSIMAIDGLLNGINQESVTFAMLNLIFWVLNFRMVMKSSPWGEVVEKGNGQPVALALVRIMDKDARRLVKTAVSNQTGHFSVFISRGEYRVITSKTGYTPDQPIPFMVGDKIAAVNRKIEIQKVSA